MACRFRPGSSSSNTRLVSSCSSSSFEKYDRNEKNQTNPLDRSSKGTDTRWRLFQMRTCRIVPEFSGGGSLGLATDRSNSTLSCLFWFQNSKISSEMPMDADSSSAFRCS